MVYLAAREKPAQCYQSGDGGHLGDYLKNSQLQVHEEENSACIIGVNIKGYQGASAVMQRVKLQLGAPAFHIRVSVQISDFCFQPSFLGMLLGGSR